MASKIKIPVDAHMLTLLVSEHKIEEYFIKAGPGQARRRRRVKVQIEVPPEIDTKRLRQGFSVANEIWKPADISFQLRQIKPAQMTAPLNKKTLDKAQVHDVARKFPAKKGVSLVVIDKFTEKSLGGRSIQEKAFCVVDTSGHPAFGGHLAHEFGHLLSLDHLEKGHKLKGWKKLINYNLMYEGARAGTELAPEQIIQARASNLAQRPS